jgi:hypothetical protein
MDTQIGAYIGNIGYLLGLSSGQLDESDVFTVPDGAPSKAPV